MLRFLKRLAIGCLGLLLLLAAVVGVVWWDLTRPLPPPAGTAAEPPPPPPAEDRRQAERTAQRLEAQVRAADSPGKGAAPDRPASRRRFSVRITAREANQMLRALPQVKDALKDKHVQQARVAFEKDQVVASARVELGDFKARVSAVGTVRAEEGKLVAGTKGLYIGSLPAPGNIRRELDKSLQEAVERFNSRLTQRVKGRIDTVQISPGVLEVRGERAVDGE